MPHTRTLDRHGGRRDERDAQACRDEAQETVRMVRLVPDPGGEPHGAAELHYEIVVHRRALARNADVRLASEHPDRDGLHEDTRLMVEACLTQEGATVIGASSAQEGLLALNEGCFDVVIADYSMPQHTGRWLVDRIQELPNPTPVIMLTGYTDRDVEELRRAVRQGFSQAGGLRPAL
jgi:CheY-like chemotaxis protein